jgi:hypothetical protein
LPQVAHATRFDMRLIGLEQHTTHGHDHPAFGGLGLERLELDLQSCIDLVSIHRLPLGVFKLALRGGGITPRHHHLIGSRRQAHLVTHHVGQGQCGERKAIVWCS